jgi:hypothetical protein
MTDTTLKSVFTLDKESQVYKPAAHNLSAEQAVERFEGDENARILSQAERHRTSDALKCKACRKVAVELTSKHTSETHSDTEETAHARESEGD